MYEILRIIVVLLNINYLKVNTEPNNIGNKNVKIINSSLLIDFFNNL